MSGLVLGVPIPELILLPSSQHSQGLSPTKEKGLRPWRELETREEKEGVAGSWWMGWRTRGLVGAKENEGQSGYGQGTSGLPLSRIY